VLVSEVLDADQDFKHFIVVVVIRQQLSHTVSPTIIHLLNDYHMHSNQHHCTIY